jgi:hypothetical protein
MFLTIVLLIACAVVGTIGIPLLIRLVPPNPYYGYPARRRASKPEHWVEVNRFAGACLIGAAFVSAFLLMFYNGTWLKSGWAQLFAFLIPLGAAVGATFWFDNKDK